MALVRNERCSLYPVIVQFDDAGGALEELRKDLNAAQEVILKASRLWFRKFWVHSLTSCNEKVMGADMGIGLRHNSKSHHTHRFDDEHGHPIRKLVCTYHIVALFLLIYDRF